eukprot:jgi/Mesvir1/8059/Mv26062-RA.1
MRSLGRGCRGEVVCPTHHFSKPHCRLIKTMPPFAFCIWRQKTISGLRAESWARHIFCWLIAAGWQYRKVGHSLKS